MNSRRSNTVLPQGCHMCTSSLFCTHTFHTHTHMRASTHGCASREVMVSMVPAPGDAGWGLQGSERCKLGERWVQSLLSEGSALFLWMLRHSTPPPSTTRPRWQVDEGKSSLSQLVVVFVSGLLLSNTPDWINATARIRTSSIELGMWRRWPRGKQVYAIISYRPTWRWWNLKV